jgi:hypothetical protein
MFENLIAARDSQANLSLTNESWDVCGREKDDCDWQVLYQRNVKTIVAVIADIRSFQDVETWLVKTSLCLYCQHAE